MPISKSLKPIGFRLALPVFIVAFASQGASSSSGAIQFDEGDFQVSAQAALINDESKSLVSKLYTAELYSAQMKTGKVYSEQLSGRYIKLNVRSRRSFYYVAKLDENLFMQVGQFDPDCRLIDSAQLAKRLFGASPLDDSPGQNLRLPNLLMMLPVRESARSRHVFGLARLLLFVDQMRAQFQPYEPKSTRYFKNSQINEFGLSFSAPNGAELEQIDMRIKVAAGPKHRADELGDRLPMRVRLKLPGRAQLLVDFNQVKPFQPDRTSFNLPAGRGCSQWLLDTVDGQSSEASRHPEEIFSFKFELHKMNGSSRSSRHVQSSFVAYDGQVGLMRLESMRLSDGRPKQELTLSDLNLGLKFHVSGAPSGASHKQLLVDSSRSQGGPKLVAAGGQFCSKTRASKLELLPCERVVPPTTHMAQVGASEVRGVECLVFESKAKRLPRMIFEPVGWLEKKREKVAYDLSAAEFSLDNDKGDDRPDYRLVYHLAAHDAEQPGRLLRLDVYDSEASHKFQVEVYNFQWRLAEAPNGDSQQDLFTLKGRCEPPDAWRHLTEVQLELELGRDASQALAKLSHSPTRQSELVRGVAGASISGSQILMASSQVVAAAAGKVRGTLKLLPGWLLRGPPLIRVLAIGWGVPRFESGPSSESYSFSECFWQAAAVSSAESGLEVATTKESELIGVFAFCFGRCWFDPGARLRPLAASSDGRKSELASDVFQLHPEAEASKQKLCQLFALKQQQVAPVEDSTSSWSIELQLDEWRLQLEDKTIDLAGEPFKVARVQLGLSSAPARPTADEEEEGDEFGGSEFGGVAFVEATRDENSNAVWRPPKQVDSFEHCHSECIANSTCRSYSFCLRPNGLVECLLASYNLMGRRIRTELRSRSTKGSGSFALPIGDEQEQSMQLRASKRCRLVAKLARDLFKRKEEPNARKSQIYAAQISAVSSQEQCAEMCLKSNAGFFRRLARFRVEIGVPSGGIDSYQLNKSLELYDKHLDTLRYWCDRYKFLSLKSSSKRARELREQLKGLGSRELQEKTKQVGAFGLCYLARGKWARSDTKPRRRREQPSNATGSQTGGGDKSAGSGANSSSKAAADKVERKVIAIEMDAFEFRYSVLYQRQEGFRLFGSKSGGPEVESQLKSMNGQTILEKPRDLDLCARWCFTQSSQWCRSFDVVHVNSSAMYCVLNSLSFREALKVARDEASLVQVRQEANAAIRFEHFEPLDGYTLDIVELKVDEDEEVQGDAREEEDGRDETETIEANQSNNLLTVCILGGLVAGLALATLAVTNYDRRQQRLAASRQIIPEVNLARLSFSLSADDSGRASLMSLDQLEIQHQT